MPLRLHLRTADTAHTAEVVGGDVRLVDTDTTLAVVDNGDGRFVVSGAAGSHDGIAATSGTTVWVSVGGSTFAFEISSGARAGAALDDDALVPPMAATVVRIAVSVGQAVQRGDLLIALEAMKMELPIRAPRDGIVAAIHCREGELVQKGFRLIEF